VLPDRGARLGGFSLLREQKPARVCAFPSHESRTVSEWRASREAGISVRFECPELRLSPSSLILRAFTPLAVPWLVGGANGARVVTARGPGVCASELE